MLPGMFRRLTVARRPDQAGVSWTEYVIATVSSSDTGGACRAGPQVRDQCIKQQR